MLRKNKISLKIVLTSIFSLIGVFAFYGIAQALTIPAQVGPEYAQVAYLTSNGQVTQRLSVYKDLGGQVKFTVRNNDGSIDMGSTVKVYDNGGNLVGATGDDDNGVLSVNETDLRGEGFSVDVEGFLGVKSANDIPLDTRNVNQPITPNTNPPGSGNNGGGSNNGPGGGNSGGGSGSGSKLVPCDGADCRIDDIKKMAVNIFNYLMGFGAIVAIGAIVISGFQYIMSQGDSKQLDEAKGKLQMAIIGLVILAVSVLLVNTILRWAGVTGGAGFTQVEDIQ